MDNEEQYTEEELKEYERMLMEEEQRRRQQGAFDSHAQPGVVVRLTTAATLSLYASLPIPIFYSKELLCLELSVIIFFGGGGFKSPNIYEN